MNKLTNKPYQFAGYFLLYFLLISLFLLWALSISGCKKKEPDNSLSLKTIANLKTQTISTIPKNANSFYLYITEPLPNDSSTLNNVFDVLKNEKDGNKLFSSFQNILLKYGEQKPKDLIKFATGFSIKNESKPELLWGGCLAFKNSALAKDLLQVLSSLKDNTLKATLNSEENRLFLSTSDNHDLISTYVNNCFNPIVLSESEIDLIITDQLKDKFYDSNNIFLAKIDTLTYLNQLPETKNLDKVFLKNTPNNIYASMDFNKIFNIDVFTNLNIDSNNQELQNFLEAIASSQYNPYTIVNDQSSVVFSINPKLLSVAFNDLTNKPDINLSKEYIDLIKNLYTIENNIVFSLLDLSKDAIFPDLNILIPSSQPESLKVILQEFINKSLKDSVPVEPWLSKEVNNVKFEYINSPFGIGIYLGTSKDLLVLSSSENGIVNYFNKTQSNLNNFLSDKGFKNLNDPAIGSIFINFPKIAVLVDNMQSSLSLFTGGQSTLNNQQIANLKKYSLMNSNITTNRQKLNLNIQYLPKVIIQ